MGSGDELVADNDNDGDASGAVILCGIAAAVGLVNVDILTANVRGAMLGAETDGWPLEVAVGVAAAAAAATLVAVETSPPDNGDGAEISSASVALGTANPWTMGEVVVMSAPNESGGLDV